MTRQDLIHDEEMGKYFTIMLNMADDDLDPYQYRLLAHFKRVCGKDGKCFQGTRRIAKVCQMSVGKVVSTRRELEQLGYIKIVERPDSTLLITIVDRMRENIERYAKRSQDEQSVQVVNSTVHDMNERISYEEEPSKEAKRTLKPSKKKKEVDYTQHDALINAWATALDLPGLGMGITYIEEYRRAEAEKLIAKNVTPDEVMTYIRTFKAGREDYRFGYLLKDIIEYREKNIRPAPAPRPVVTLEAPITLTDDELAERRRLVEAARAERERISA